MPLDDSLRTLAELRHRFLDGAESAPPELLAALKSDSRRGARELADRIEARRERGRAAERRLAGLLTFERELWSQGFEQIAGVDEAGVGPLAGPVVAGAAILARDRCPRGVDDSKKLDPAERARLEVEIKASAVAWAIGVASVEEIDRLNIYRASLLAMRRAVMALGTRPDHLFVDARTVPDVDVPQRGIIKGDAKSASIAAASILAKTARDRMLEELAALHPGYGFEQHKGYPTPEHVEALRRLGASAAHRRSFAPVRAVLGLGPRQSELPLGR